MAREQLGTAPSINAHTTTKNYVDNAAVASAAKLTTPRTISLGSGLGGSATFDGSGNITIDGYLGPDNSDTWANQRVIRNGNSNPSFYGSDGMYIGYANTNGGITRIYGGGSTTNPVVINANGVLDIGGIYDGNARMSVSGLGNKHGAVFHTPANDGGWFSAYFARSASVGVYNAFYYGGTQSGYISTTNGSNLLFVSNSDYRLKENVQPLISGTDTIAALRPVSYEWKLDGSYGEGFIAHEVQEVIPEAVGGVKDAELPDGTIVAQGIDMGKIVPHLVSAVQELTTRLEAAEARITQLEGQLNG